MDNQCFELEMRVIHLEKFVEELNEVVIEQQRQLDRLRQEFTLLKQKHDPALMGELRPHDEKPPHY